jgi:hypothetical protein
MPAKDIFHDTVKRALEKEGWMITHDPLFIEWGEAEIYVDLGAEKLLAAQKGQRKIAVEIKSFLAPSVMSDFHNAVGQYIDYRTVLDVEEPERRLYLAVSNDVYQSFFQRPFTQRVLTTNHIAVMVYHIQDEVILQWLE